MILVGTGEEGPFQYGGTIHLDKSAGQKEARKRYVQQTADVQKALDQGEEVWVAAIPSRSWAPQQVTIEQPPPRLHV